MFIRGYKYRFYPNKNQEISLRKLIGSARYVYNKALHIKSSLWKNEKKNISGYDLCKELTLWKKDKETSFLKDVATVPLQQSFANLDTAFQRFFDKISKYPKFKKKKHGGSVTFMGTSFRIKNGYCFLARIEKPLKVKWSRELPKNCVISKATVSLDSTNHWHISFSVDDTTIKHLPPSPNKIGIDLGLSDFMITSNGDKVENPRHEKKLRVNLKRLQRKFSKKKKGSKNKEKLRVKVARLHKRISNSRKDFLHKLSTNLINENQVIIIEDLNVKGMMKNHKLARAIADTGWRTFRSFLKYKAEWYGREFITINRFFPSSKICSNCGYKIEGKLELSVREWKCERCNVQHDRDINAAKNILAEGHSVSKKPVKKELHKPLRSIPKGSEIRRNKTQEPPVLRN